jgi:hypothetical protein
MKTAFVTALGIGISALAAPAFGQGGNPQGVDPTHYQCYRVSAAKPLKPQTVKLRDQFMASEAKLGPAMLLCNPVEKNGEAPKDRETHLTCYQIPAKPARKKVLVRHQFGEQQLTVGGTVVLCLPSVKKEI